MPDLPSGPPAGAGRRRRSRSRLTRILGTAAATAVVVLLGNQAVSSFQIGSKTNPSGGSGSPSATPSVTASSASPAALASGRATASAPSATPRPRSIAAEPNRTLKENSLYSVDLGGVRVSCAIKVRPAKPALRNAELTPYLQSLLDCMVKTLERPLAAEGFILTAPKIRVYKSSIKSPCGRFDQKGAPAYYCSANRTIYWPASRDDGREAYTFARLGYVALIAHEFGHHLQSTTGMVNQYGRRYAKANSSERYLLSRRLELQAQCFEGVFLRTVGRSLRLNAVDREELRMWHSFTGDEDPPSSRKPDHGRSATQIRWLDRGLDSQDFGRCNTWSARSSDVR